MSSDEESETYEYVSSDDEEVQHVMIAIVLSKFPPENHLNFIGCPIPPKELVKAGFFYSGYTDKNVYFFVTTTTKNN